jgi:threonine/homoserine/homoserine lactone efflux protein
MLDQTLAAIDSLALLAFLPAALALNLTPGADMMFCLGQGLRAGPRAALAASAGVAFGGMVHVTAAGLGLGALVTLHPGLFDAIRWGGVAYLLWLAYRALVTQAYSGAGATGRTRSAFRQGTIVNLTNPKVALFVLAFIPQFVDPEGPVLGQFLLYGAILSSGGFLVNGAAGACAGRAGRRLMSSAGFERWLNRIAATIFVALALRLALLQRN